MISELYRLLLCSGLDGFLTPYHTEFEGDITDSHLLVSSDWRYGPLAVAKRWRSLCLEGHQRSLLCS